MTPKEKAKELVELFSYNCYECDYWFNAHASAHKLVDEMLNESQYTDGYYDRYGFWEKVKKEIISYGE